MKYLKWIIIVLALGIGSLYVFKIDYLIKAVRTIYLNGYKTAFLDDYNYFDNRTIENGVAQPWANSKDYNLVKPSDKLLETHKELGTIAYVIIKNDSVFHESYYDNYTENSKTNSFSMAKSIISAALGKAIMEGKIKSLDQKVVDFLPELKGQYAKDLTVGDLSSMSSGMNWDEHYSSVTSVTTQAYFDNDIRKMMLNIPITKKPGVRFSYQSGDTQLLAMVLEKAIGTTISEYVSEKFWKPMGASQEALWQLDHEGDGIEKAYCCVASNAKDFARFGKLYKDYGKWNGKTILDSTFVSKSINPRFADSPEYGYGWWLHNFMNKKMFYMRGHLGQFVIVVPQDNLIIVRLGHIKGLQTDKDPHSNDFYVYVGEAYKMLEQRK
ncbi:MAG: serine hydrolase [Flavobacterium sp.]|nr:serine hydrolase [Candidatus Neoflavobacterium equi]